VLKQRRASVGRPVVRRCFAFGVTVIVVVTGAGCSKGGLSRDDLRDAYVERIAAAGVERPVAECVVDRLFDEMTDDELRRFNTEGTSLSESQANRIAQLADACGA
jgi:hypothetical protein